MDALRYTVRRRVGGREVVVIVAGRDARRYVETWDGRSVDDISWNILVAGAIFELYPQASIGLEATIIVDVGETRCECPAPVDIAVPLACNNIEAILLVEIKYVRRWMGVFHQLRQYGARVKRQESIAAIEALARCLDVTPSLLRSEYGINAYMLALIGDKPRDLNEDEMRGYVADLTGYPTKRVYVVSGVKGPSQAKPLVKKALQKIIDSTSCEPSTRPPLEST